MAVSFILIRLPVRPVTEAGEVRANCAIACFSSEIFPSVSYCFRLGCGRDSGLTPDPTGCRFWWCVVVDPVPGRVRGFGCRVADAAHRFLNRRRWLAALLPAGCDPVAVDGICLA